MNCLKGRNELPGMRLTQKEIVLNHLIRYGWITSLIMEECGIIAPHAVIHDLRALGHKIESSERIFQEDMHGETHNLVRYALASATLNLTTQQRAEDTHQGHQLVPSHTSTPSNSLCNDMWAQMIVFKGEMRNKVQWYTYTFDIDFLHFPNETSEHAVVIFGAGRYYPPFSIGDIHGSCPKLWDEVCSPESIDKQIEQLSKGGFDFSIIDSRSTDIAPIAEFLKNRFHKRTR